MNKIIVMVLGLFLSTSGMAETFYLHANMATGADPATKSLWFNDPTGGTDMATLGADFAGSRFNVNTYSLKAPNITGSSTFKGTVIVEAPAGTCEMLSTTWTVEGMDISSAFGMRVRRAPKVNLAVSSLNLQSSADLSFRLLDAKSKTLNVTIAGLTGSGKLTFGKFDIDMNGIWKLSITEAAPEFTGTIELTRGELTFGNDFSLSNAAFSIDSNSVHKNSIVLANNVSFHAVSFGKTSLPSGTYTASELNTVLKTSRFSGSGVLTVQ